MTTHYLEEAESLCQRLAIIDDGRIIENSDMNDLLMKLHMETFILDLDSVTQHVPQIPGYTLRHVDGSTLEVDVSKEQSLNELFSSLSTQGIQVRSMRNKRSRLEELFMRIVENGNDA